VEEPSTASIAEVEADIQWRAQRAVLRLTAFSRFLRLKPMIEWEHPEGRMLRAALCVSFVSVVTLAKAAELETTHIFGFTFGSDVNAVGEKEAESEAVGRFGKSAGTYSAISKALGVKFAPLRSSPT
jgi:hypothetical protein